MNFGEQIRAAVSEGVARPCVLCETATKHRGVFLTDAPEFGAKVGQRRAIVYPLCEHHPHTELNFRAVEEVLLDSLKRNHGSI